MKILNDELKYNIWDDVHRKIFEHAPCNSHVRKQIENNLGWQGDDDSLIKLKVNDPQWYIRNDLDETD